MTDITHLPPEVLDIILSCIEDPTDVKHFALTSRSFAAVASPNHTQLRAVWCPRQSISVWNSLATNAAQARNVRYLHIGDYEESGPCHFPKVSGATRTNTTPRNRWRGELEADSELHDVLRAEEALIIAAVKNMPHLLAFRWDCFDPPVVIAQREPDEQDIWTALSSCRDLRELRITEYYCYVGGPGRTLFGAERFAFSSLTVFEYRTRYVEEGGVTPDYTSLGIMLRERCPRLQRLNLVLAGFPPPDIGDSILRGRWPDLQHLFLLAAACRPEALVTFLSAHPRLQTVGFSEFIGCREIPGDILWDPALNPQIDAPLACPAGILPNLSEIECCAGHAFDILSASLTGDRADRHISVEVLFYGDGSTVHRLADFLSFIRRFPNVQVSDSAVFQR
ncbi:hypothetical protein BV25DRAFT_1827303 [Artomyces pyxidatus]|uniref:Uncharacterized protein n=1 Tax=Artomyces pyxidatus TaxID=48021 RepID=A0ACB8SZB2_9AGAM|nr:hypothetical protein BV25DRAFT_1827303 [Artomyces pyxidatus]